MIDMDRIKTIILDDVLYVLTLVYVCAMSFAVGLIMGMILS